MYDWQGIEKGTRWQQLADGRINLEGEGPVRTEGPPVSMHTLYQDHGAAIRQACEKFDLEPALICAIIACEATREQPDWWRFDPTCYRKEPRLWSDGSTMHSAGLMQTLEKVAREVNSRHGIYRDVEVDEATGQIRRPIRSITVEDLKVAEISIMLGAGHLAHLRDHSGNGWARPAGDDPILLCAAYNAGGVYASRKNRFRLRTYGADRVVKFASFYNDFLSLKVDEWPD